MHFSTQTRTQNMEQCNNSPTEKVQNTTSGTKGQWIRKEKKYICTFRHMQLHTKTCMGQDNNSPAENVQNTSGTLGQWIRKEMHFSTQTHTT